MSHQLVIASFAHFGSCCISPVGRGFTVSKIRHSEKSMSLNSNEAGLASPTLGGVADWFLVLCGVMPCPECEQCGHECVPWWLQEAESWLPGRERSGSSWRQWRPLLSVSGNCWHMVPLFRSTPALVPKVLAKPSHPPGPVWKSLEVRHSSSATAVGLVITMQMLTAFGLPL